MDTAQQELTGSAQKLLADLELIERYGDRFSYSELMDAIRRTQPILDGLMEQAPGGEALTLAGTARSELQRVLLDPNSLTEGLIVVILMICRSALRQLLAASES